MSRDSEIGEFKKISFFEIFTLSLTLLLFFSFTKETAAQEQSDSDKLVFTNTVDNGYAFDTGVLRGKLQPGKQTLGLSSVVHLPSGTKLSGNYGIMSFYRVFTTDKRYGHAAWDWPCHSKILPDGELQIFWPGSEKPVEISATYTLTSKSTVDLITVVKAQQDLNNFELFLASYFTDALALPYVYVYNNPDTEGKPGMMLAKKTRGDWQMFPRDDSVLHLIKDGRWSKEPNPVDWAIMPRMKAPICLRRGGPNKPTVILMSPPGDCFAIATPYEGESHCSLYLSLFGRDIKAGQVTKARLRLVVVDEITDKQVLDLYKKYIQELADSASSRKGN